MGRYHFAEVEIEEDDQIFVSDYRRFAKEEIDPPRWSPIRRKDKLRQEEEMRPKAKRNHKKIQQKIKYNWQGE
jgi:hypothetical protein